MKKNRFKKGLAIALALAMSLTSLPGSFGSTGGVAEAATTSGSFMKTDAASVSVGGSFADSYTGATDYDKVSGASFGFAFADEDSKGSVNWKFTATANGVSIAEQTGTTTIASGGAVAVQNVSFTAYLAKSEKLDMTVSVTAVSDTSSNNSNEILACITDDGSSSRIKLSVVGGAADAAITSFTVSPTSLDMVAGDTEQLTATYTPAQKRTVTYTSSDTDVVTVSSSGLVTAVGPGTATISLTCGSKMTSVPVSVYALVASTETLTYNGSRQTPASITYTNGSTSLDVTASTDFGNPIDAGTYTAKYTTAGGRQLTCEFTINPKTITSVTVPDSGFSMNSSTKEPTSGSKLTVDGSSLTYGTDFYVTGVTQSSDISTGTVTYTFDVVGTGNYTGTVSGVTYRVSTGSGTGEYIDLSSRLTVDCTYTSVLYKGSAYKPGSTGETDKLVVALDGSSTGISLSTALDGKVSVNYNGTVIAYVNYSNNINATTATTKATVEVVGNASTGYTGSASDTFVISKLPITNAAVSVSIPSTVYTYTGSQISPEPTVTFNGTSLVKGTDYTVSLGDNISIGEGTVKVTGINNFKGSKTLDFEIKGSIADSSITTVTIGGKSSYSVDYDGSAQTPVVEVYVDDEYLTENSDFRVEYSNNTNAGTATVTIVGCTGSDYAGQTTTRTFKINAITMPDTLNITASNLVYNGQPQLFTSCSIDGLTRGVDYNITKGVDSAGNETTNGAGTASGTVTVTATGIGNYTGTATGTYKIKVADITDYEDSVFKIRFSNGDASGEHNETYTGEAIKPKLVVTLNGVSLTEGTDYSLAYAGNVDVSTSTEYAKITLTGLGSDSTPTGSNIKGEKTVYFKIVPQSITSLYVTMGGQPVYYDSASDEWRTAYTTTYNGKINYGSIVVRKSMGSSEISTNYYGKYTKNELSMDVQDTYPYGNVIELRGVGIYEGSSMLIHYTIEPKDLSASNVTIEQDGTTTVLKNGVYSPKLIITDAGANKQVLTEGTDYEVIPDSDATIAGKYTATINGMGNYTGTSTLEYLVGDDISTLSSFIESFPGSGTSASKVGSVYQVDYTGSHPSLVVKTADNTATLTGIESSAYDALPSASRAGYDFVYSWGDDVVDFTTASETHTVTIDAAAESTKYFSTTPIVMTYHINQINLATLQASKLLTLNPNESTDVSTFDYETNTLTFTYDGSPHHMSETVTRRYKFGGDDTLDLIANKDFTFSNNPVGPAVNTLSVALTGMGNYTGTATFTLAIGAKTITESMVSVAFVLDGEEILYSGRAGAEHGLAAAAATYTGNQIKGTVRVIDGSTQLNNGTDYKVTYGTNLTPGTGAGTVTIEGLGNYKTLTPIVIPFDIRQISLSGITITPDPLNWVAYTGSAVTPSYVLYNSDGIALKEGVDYKAEVTNNVDPTTEAKLTITPVDDSSTYTGSLTRNFAIRCSLRDGDSDSSNDKVRVEVGGVQVDSVVATPQVIQLKKDGTRKNDLNITAWFVPSDPDKQLVEGTDYTVSYSDPAPGLGTCTLTGIGAYTGEFEIPVLYKVKLSDCTVTDIPNQTYTGSEVKPHVTVKWNSSILSEGLDYYVEYQNNVDAGSGAILKIHPCDDITYLEDDDKGRTFNIYYNLATANVTKEISAMSYTGSALKPTLEFTVTGKILEKGVNYEVVYSSNVLPGTATITIQPVGGSSSASNLCMNTFEYQFLIKGLELKSTLNFTDDVDNLIYDGTAKKPAVQVLDEKGNIVPSTNYTLTYSQNIDAGMATVTAVGNGGYTGTAIGVFEIQPYDLGQGYKNGEVSCSTIGSYTYNGEEQVPVLSVMRGSLGLSSDDYTVAVYNGVNAGTGEENSGTWTGPYYIVTGSSPNYKNSFAKGFTIAQASIGDVVIANASSPYTGKKQTADLTVYPQGGSTTPLVRYTSSHTDGDYEVTGDENMIDRGVYSLTITGRNNYYGTRTVDYTITSRSLAGDYITITLSNGDTYIGVPDSNGNYLARKAKSDGSVNENGTVLSYPKGEYVQPTVVSVVDSGIATYDSYGNELTSYSVLTEDTDYTVSYVNTTNTGDARDGSLTSTPHVLFTGKGDYEGSRAVFFSMGTMLDDGTYGDDGSYDSSQTGTFLINVAYSNGSSSTTYNGKVQKPTLSVTNKTTKASLVAGRDYSITWPDDLTNAGDKEVVVTGINDYYGKLTGTFRINPKTWKVSDAEDGKTDSAATGLTASLSLSTSYINTDSVLDRFAYYTGSEIEPDTVVKDVIIGRTLTRDVDYYVTYSNNVSVTLRDEEGNALKLAKVTITPMGNYTGSVINRYFWILPIVMNDSNLVIQWTDAGSDSSDCSVDYDGGNEVVPAYTVHYITKNNTGDVVSDVELVKDYDYTESFYNSLGEEMTNIQANFNAGRATLAVTGTGNYTSGTTASYIIRANLTDPDDTWIEGQVPTPVYSGTQPKAFPVVVCGGNVISLPSSDDERICDNPLTYANDDFTLVFSSSNNFADATGTITSNDPTIYYGEFNYDFTTTTEVDSVYVVLNEDTYEYTSEPVDVEYTVYTSQDAVVPDSYCTVSYYVAGTQLDVTDNVGRHMVLDPSGHTDAGTYYAIVDVSIGDSEGEFILGPIYIVGKSVDDLDYYYADPKVYTGSQITPPIEVKDGKRYLEEGTDYTVSYGENILPTDGTNKATITVTGMGNYSGTVTKEFTIRPQSAVNLVVSDETTSSMRVAWKRNTAVDKWYVKLSDGKTTKTFTTDGSSNYLDATGLTAGTTYAITAYSTVTIGDKTYYSDTLSTTGTTAMAGVDLTEANVTSPSTGKAKVTWEVPGYCTGYEIYRAASATDPYKLVVALPYQDAAGNKYSSYSNSGLTSGHTYYYKMRAYIVTGETQSDGSTKYTVRYSSMTEPVAVTVK